MSAAVRTLIALVGDPVPRWSVDHGGRAVAEKSRWGAPVADRSVDLVILGGGSGGYACALRAAELGMSVVLIEKDKVGGTCLHRGCIPTKALLHAGEVADSARESDQFGVLASFDGIDMDRVNAYKDGVVKKMHRGLSGLIKGRGIQYVEGSGRLVSPTAVQVGDDTYTGGHVVLATGSYARTLPGLEIDGERVITSDQALRLDRVPGSVVVLGGGVIGVEFASVWKSFGASVTIVEALPHLVPLEDEASSQLLERAFRRRGIGYQLGARFAGVARTESGVRVSLEGGESLDADLLLVAVGRGPVSADLGYEEAGVRLDRGFVVVDEYCRTDVPTISAVGDLIPTLQLAHAGFAEGILVAERLAGLPVVPIDYAGVPRVTYCEPEVASVGLTQAQAEEKYGADKVATQVYDLTGNGKSQILKTAGSVKLVAVKDGQVLGAHLVGSRVGELIAEAQLIYNWEALPGEVAQLIHPHPTQTEAIGEAHLALAGKPLHVH
jgi:dihydrolipoamide dehydrogenase